MTADVWGVVANAAESNRRFRRRAKVWLMWTTGGGVHYGRASFYGMSPGGRMIECWCPFQRLSNFRAAWVPPHLRQLAMQFDNRAEADRLANSLGGRL